MSLRLKFTGIIAACILFGSLLFFAALAISARGEVLIGFRDWGVPVVADRARALSKTLRLGDVPQMREAAETVAAGLPHVYYVAFRDEKGAVVFAHFLGRDASASPDELRPLEPGQEARALEPFAVGGTRVLPLLAPLVLAQGAGEKEGAKAAGTLEVGLDLDAPLAEARTRASGPLLASALGILASFGVALSLTRRLLTRLQRLSQATSGIASGDLAQVIEVDGNDEIGALAHSFVSMTGGLRTMIADLRASAGEVEREVSNILSTATQQSAMSNEQASAINETSTTVTEIAQTSKQATEHADSVIKVAQRSEDLTREGQKTVEEAMAGMQGLAEQVKAIALSITELSERTMQIGDIIATVKELAEQSNLLALNASIEAAKAGDHGRGFAVVAMEMRNLAEQSKVAAGEVRAILSEVQKGTKSAVSATEEGSKRAHHAIELAKGAGGAIDGLAEVIRDSSAAARQIATNTRQQTIGVEQIVSAITELSAAMSDALEGTRRIEKVAGNLTTVSHRLTDLVSRYRV